MSAQANTQTLSDWQSLSSDEKNARGCIDFTDKTPPITLTKTAEDIILVKDEVWESQYDGTGNQDDTLIFQSVAKNVHGPNADGKFYMYYAQHEGWSGIGCAVADAITGPYTKIRNLPGRTDSQVLVVNRPVNENQVPPRASHFSSPFGPIWNETTQLWHLYFHFDVFNNPEQGYQHTTLATCSDLSSHQWTLYNPLSPGVPNPYVLGANSSESWRAICLFYGPVCRMPNGEWFAALGGGPSPGTGTRTIGVFISDDGKSWIPNAANPSISAANDVTALFLGYMGNGWYLLAYKDWTASPWSKIVYTRDFVRFESQTTLEVALWDAPSVPMGARREGSNLYLFGGHKVYTFAIG